MSFLAKPRANLQGRAQRPQRHLPRRVEEFSFLALKNTGHGGKAAVGAACLALSLTPTCMSFIPRHTSSGTQLPVTLTASLEIPGAHPLLHTSTALLPFIPLPEDRGD